MKKLIAFNWKENPNSLEEAELIFTPILDLAKNTQETEIIVCPPDVYLSKISQLISRDASLHLGAQNVFWEESGAHTGEISPLMLKNYGVKYVIVGHSERRALGETDQIVGKKILAVLTNGITAILCVGESSTIRKKGDVAIKKFIQSQLADDLSQILNIKSYSLNLVVVYEPIWAIGTGTPCEPKDALVIIKFIKEVLAASYHLPTIRVLYGGSVTGKNILDYIKYDEIDGVLVGGASLKPEQFKGIFK